MELKWNLLSENFADWFHIEENLQDFCNDAKDSKCSFATESYLK